MKKTTCFFLLLLVFMWCSYGFAENSGYEKSQPKLNFGLGTVYSSTPYRGADSELTPFPLLAYEGKRFFLRGTKLGVHLMKQDRFVLSLLGSYRGDGYESGDSSFLQGMSDRDGTLEVGIQASLTSPFGQFRTSLVSDILGEHNGHEAKLTFSKRFFLQKFSISPSASLIWKSGQLSNYYYGVRMAEATINRPAYKVDSSFAVQLGVMTNYRLSEHWFVSGQIALTRLADEISDSPIVEDDFVTTAFVGIGYRF
jgi:outer membrane protein